MRSLATLEAVLEGFTCQFDARWEPGVEAGFFANGSGDELRVWFGPMGCVIVGFDHESPMSPYAQVPEVWPGVLEGIPEPLWDAFPDRRVLHDPETFDDITFCIWRLADALAIQLNEYVDVTALRPILERIGYPTARPEE